MIVLAVEVESRTYANLPLMSFMSYLISDLDLALLGLCNQVQNSTEASFTGETINHPLRIPNFLSSLSYQKGTSIGILTLRINFNWPYALFSFYLLCRGLVRENGMGLLELGCSCRWVSWKKQWKKFNSVGTKPLICSCHLPTGKSPLAVNLLFFWMEFYGLHEF
jgi:hypothetical protein